jgi:hypothetical protein
MSNFERRRAMLEDKPLRNIFTSAKPSKLETLADTVIALVIGAALAVGLLAYFDVLVK